jgi:hypothetical protein
MPQYDGSMGATGPCMAANRLFLQLFDGTGYSRNVSRPISAMMDLFTTHLDSNMFTTVCTSTVHTGIAAKAFSRPSLKCRVTLIPTEHRCDMHTMVPHICIMDTVDYGI